MFKREIESSSSFTTNFNKNFLDQKEKRENTHTTSKNFLSVDKRRGRRPTDKSENSNRNLNNIFKSEEVDSINQINWKSSKSLLTPQKPAALEERNLNNYIYNESCDKDSFSLYQIKNQHESFNHNSMSMNPMNIDIEYSFSPKLLIKSIHTIIDNYENVIENLGNSNERAYSKREASHSRSHGRKGSNKENKDTNISKIFNSIFKNNNQEFDSAFNKNEFVVNSDINEMNEFSFQHEALGENYNFHHYPQSKNSACLVGWAKDRLEFSFQGSNCLVFSPNQASNTFGKRVRSRVRHRFNNLPDNTISQSDAKLIEKNHDPSRDDLRIFKIEKIIKFEQKTKLFDLMEYSNKDHEINTPGSIYYDGENKKEISKIQELDSNDNGDTITFNPNSNHFRKHNQRLATIANKFNHNYMLLKSNLLHIPNGNVKSYLEKTLNSERETNDNRYKLTSISTRNHCQKMMKKKVKQRFKYMMYTADEKQFCTDLVTARNYDINDVANCCLVPLKSLKRWIKVGSIRKAGGGRKVEDPELESKLLIWIQDITSKGIRLRYATIREKALKLTKSKSFMASKGWFEKFKKKYDLKCGRNVCMNISQVKIEGN